MDVIVKLWLGLGLVLLVEAGGFTWEQCPSQQIQPRLSHTSVYAPSLSSVLVYGGQNNLDAVAYDDVWSYDPEAQTWEELATQNKPSGRYGHTATVVANEMVVIGGDNMTHQQADVWALNLDAQQWRQVLANNVAASLTGHSAVVTKNGTVLVYGGMREGVRSGDLYSLSQDIWSQVITTGGPTARWKHSAVLLGDDMWIFAGQDDVSLANNDLHRYNLVSNTWQAFNTSVPHRFGHTAVISPAGNSMIVYGGHNGIQVLDDVWEFSFDSMMWQQLQPNGSVPSRRNSHTATTWRSIDGGNYMFMFGGVSVFGPKNDAFQLDLGRLPAIEARTTAQGSNVVLFFSTADSPNHRLIPTDPCTDKVIEGLYIDFQFLKFIEVTDAGEEVRTTMFPSSGFSLVQGGSATLIQQFNFTTTISEGVLGVDYSLFSNETYIEYGNVTLQNLPGTNKWEIKLQGWRFMNQSNRLELRVKLTAKQTLKAVSGPINIPSQRIARYLVRASDTSLTVDLANFVLIDGELDRPLYHRFEGLDHLVLSFPYFHSNLSYDPNFGLLIGGQDKRKNDEPCGGSGFDMWWLICLVAAGVIIPLLVFGGAIIYIRHQRKKAAHRALIQERIRAFTKVEEERMRKPTTTNSAAQNETPASVV